EPVTLSMGTVSKFSSGKSETLSLNCCPRIPRGQLMTKSRETGPANPVLESKSCWMRSAGGSIQVIGIGKGKEKGVIRFHIGSKFPKTGFGFGSAPIGIKPKPNSEGGVYE